MFSTGERKHIKEREEDRTASYAFLGSRLAQQERKTRKGPSVKDAENVGKSSRVWAGGSGCSIGEKHNAPKEKDLYTKISYDQTGGSGRVRQGKEKNSPAQDRLSPTKNRLEFDEGGGSQRGESEGARILLVTLLQLKGRSGDIWGWC